MSWGSMIMATRVEPDEDTAHAVRCKAISAWVERWVVATKHRGQADPYRIYDAQVITPPLDTPVQCIINGEIRLGHYTSEQQTYEEGGKTLYYWSGLYGEWIEEGEPVVAWSYLPHMLSSVRDDLDKIGAWK